MSGVCRSCGQPLPEPSTKAALLRLLRDRRREHYAYRIAGSSDWAVTYTRNARFSAALIADLAARGELAPVYPGTPSEQEAYGDAAYYGRPAYVAEVAAKVARSGARRGSANPADHPESRHSPDAPAAPAAKP